MTRIAVLILSSVALLGSCGNGANADDLDDRAHRSAVVVSAVGTMRGGDFTLRAELGGQSAPAPASSEGSIWLQPTVKTVKRGD